MLNLKNEYTNSDAMFIIRSSILNKRQKENEQNSARFL